MKHLLMAAALLTSSLAVASNWEIDSAHASANFAIRHMMVSTVRGTMGQVSGSATIDDKDMTKSSFTATVDVKGINTKEPKRDDHLRSKDFFEAEKFPTITFKSTKIQKQGGDKLKVTGDLTMHGVTKSVTLDATLTKAIANPFTKVQTRGLSAKAKLNRKDFGLNWNVAVEAGGVLVGDEVDIDISAELLNKDAGAAAESPM